jgi:hypothetical protein
MIKIGMSAHKNRTLAVLSLVFFLSSCGDLGMVLPSQGSYRVNAQVDDDYTLDAYSVIGKNSRIRPYFVNSVVNDPDVRGITVFVQDYSGEVVSRKVQYLLAEEERQKPLPELPVEPPPDTTEQGRDKLPGELPSDRSPVDRSPNEGAPGPAGAPDTAQAREGSTETQEHPPAAGGGAAETPADEGAGESRPGDAAKPAGGSGLAGDSTGDSAPADRNRPGQDLADTDSSGGSGDIDDDYSNTVISGVTGANTTDRDAADPALRGAVETGAGGGNTNTAGSDAAKTGFVPAAPVPPVLPVIPGAALPEDEIVPVKQLDQYFPEFRIIEDLAIGRYNLVFHVMGEKEILFKAVKPIYFIGDAKFSLGEIQSFLPVESAGRRLMPPGINVMLATEVSADPRLDPHIIWHSGKKIVAQGRLSEGANSLFWKTPEQTGFHSIRVEVFPLLPGDRVPGNMIGKIKELSLPVSARSEGIGHFSNSSGYPGGEFIAWYQFWGTLDDATAPNSPEKKLVPLYAQAPRWMPLGGIYGLVVGGDDGYTLPGTPFTLSGDEEGRGRILFRLGALSEGPIVNLRFAGGDAAEDGETAELDLSIAAEALTLRIASKGESRGKSLALNSDDANGFFTIIVDFTIAPEHFDAELFREDPPGTTGPLSIALTGAVRGEGSLRIGGQDGPVSGGSKHGNGTMALNELAVSYARTPLSSGEEPPESDLPETMTQEEAYPDAEPEPSSPNAL